MQELFHNLVDFSTEMVYYTVLDFLPDEFLILISNQRFEEFARTQEAFPRCFCLKRRHSRAELLLKRDSRIAKRHPEVTRFSFSAFSAAATVFDAVGPDLS